MFVPLSVQLLATRTKDADRVVCRNSISRRRNCHWLIEFAEIGNGIEMGRQTGNENGCRCCRVTRRTQIFIQVKLQFRTMDIEIGLIYPKVDTCLKCFRVVDHVSNVLLSKQLAQLRTAGECSFSPALSRPA